MLTLQVREAKTLHAKTIGLLNKKEAEPLLIRTRWGIHTFGMKYPIDVIILDNENRVAQLKKNLKPNSLFVWNPKFEHVLELPSNTIETKKIKKGQIIELVIV